MPSAFWGSETPARKGAHSATRCGCNSSTDRRRLWGEKLKSKSPGVGVAPEGLEVLARLADGSYLDGAEDWSWRIDQSSLSYKLRNCALEFGSLCPTFKK